MYIKLHCVKKPHCMRFPVLLDAKKAIKRLESLAFYIFSLTRVINSIIHNSIMLTRVRKILSSTPDKDN